MFKGESVVYFGRRKIRFVQSKTIWKVSVILVYIYIYIFFFFRECNFSNLPVKFSQFKLDVLVIKDYSTNSIIIL